MKLASTKEEQIMVKNKELKDQEKEKEKGKEKEIENEKNEKRKLSAREISSTTHYLKNVNGGSVQKISSKSSVHISRQSNG